MLIKGLLLMIMLKYQTYIQNKIGKDCEEFYLNKRSALLQEGVTHFLIGLTWQRS
jgi:predicted transglutaminase-like cysteine proteinase